MRRELSAFSRPQVWLALLTGAVGFGGFLALYSYLAPTMTSVAGLPPGDLWIVLALFGPGVTAGDLVGGLIVDRSVTVVFYRAPHGAGYAPRPPARRERHGRRTANPPAVASLWRPSPSSWTGGTGRSHRPMSGASSATAGGRT